MMTMQLDDTHSNQPIADKGAEEAEAEPEAAEYSISHSAEWYISFNECYASIIYVH